MNAFQKKSVKLTSGVLVLMLVTFICIRLTCGSSSALITAAKPNMLPRVLFNSAASWMVLWSRAALSSVLPVQPSRSTATMIDMV